MRTACPAIPHLENSVNDTPAGTAELWCPRRNEFAGTALGNALGPDAWQDLTKAFGGDNSAGPTCSYCGSIRPEEFLEKVRGGWIVVPTDQRSRCYLDKPYEPAEMNKIKERNGGWQVVRQDRLSDGDTEEEAAAAADAWWTENEAPGIGGRSAGTLYYAHLDAPQQAEFLELYRSGAMRMAWPGKFNATPSFTTPLQLAR